MINKKDIISAVFIGFNIIVIVNTVNADTYRDFNGELISEDQYVQRVNICEGLQSHDNLDKNIDCMDYALSKEIHDQWYVAYELSDQFDQFLDNNDLVTSNNLSDIIKKLPSNLNNSQ